MGIAQDLRVAARRWVDVRRAKGVGAAATPTAAGEAERDELRRWVQAFRGASAGSPVRDVQVFEIEACELPWVDTGLDLDEGQWVTTIACGRVVLSEALDIWVGPQFQLWMRVGENSPIFNGTRDTMSFRAAQCGRLYLANNFPGQWGCPHGRVSTSLEEYSKYTGGITVAAIRWASAAADGLAELASLPAGAPWLVAEMERLRDDVQPPSGWRYLWFLGRSDIFRDSTDEGHACIACHTHRNAGILQHDAVFDLTPDTRIRWAWKVDELPSVLPENTAASHDYLSVAVEFENGRDITYTWSPELPVGLGYWCPLATWKDREFHVVIRSGGAGLGTWLDEERNLHADYLHYMGEPPGRVVRIWLIAVSLFQRRDGRASFRDFALEGGQGGGRLALR